MKFKHIKYIFIVFVIFIVIFAIYKVSSKNNKKQQENEQVASEVIYQDNLRLGVANLDTINPLTTKNKEMININQLVYEPLLTMDSQYKLQFCIATEYAKTSTTTYIVKVDDNIKWSDGTSVTAKDVKFTIDLLKSTDSIFSENVKNISNSEVIDDSTIKINLNEETYFFEYNLIFPIMSQKYYEGEDFFTSSKYPIGTGLYKITSISDSQIILEKNENYRNQEKVNKNVQKISVNIFNSIGEVYNSFKMGNIDIMNTSSLVYKDYIGTIGYYAKEYKGREYDFLSCNCNDYLMKQKSVRQAINYAIDRENIISTVYDNKYYASEYVLDYGSYVYSKNVAGNGNYNPEKAKEILVADGWVYSNNRWVKNGYKLYITIGVNSSDVKRLEVAKTIKTQLEGIGMQVNISELSDSQYKWNLANKSYQILLTGVYNGFSPDVTYFYGDGNIANYQNKEVIGALNEVKNITDQKVLEEKYKGIISNTSDDCAYISLYRNRNTLLISQKLVGNFEPGNFGIFRNFESWNRE